MRNVADIYRLTALQEGLLFHSVAEPGAGLYIDQVSAELTGAFDPERFQAAWEHAVQRHAALRTAFLWDGLDEPVQVVRETVELPWALEDWRSDDAPAQARRREVCLRLERERGFAPEQAPLLRMTLARTGEQSWWWLCTLHHLVADGWSTAVLLREVFAAYATDQPESADPGDVPSFSDYIAWQDRQDLEAAERYWRRELHGFTEPTRLASPSQADSAVAADVRQEERYLSAETTSALRTVAAAHGLTLNTVLQGAWALLLSQLTRQDDVVFGVTTSGRPPELAGIERAVGLFINTLPLRVAIDPAAPLTAWLKTIQKRQIEARRFEFSPLASVQRWSEVPAGEALFESILVFENYPDGGALLPPDAGLEVGELRFDEQSNYPLALLCIPGARLRLLAIHDPSRIDTPTAQLCLKLLDRILAQLACAPGALLRDIRLADEADRRQLLAWNDTATEPIELGCMHHWIARTAERNGDALAVVGADRSLTYAELDAHAKALAAELRAAGVSRGRPVAIIAEPSAEMIVGLLGILEAGSAYVPLDPAYPPSLIRQVLDDAGAAIVVAQAALLDRLADTGARIVTLDLEVPGSPLPQVETGSAPDDLAYILYTSGTTGRPKGVPITHRNLVHSTEARLRVYGETPPRFLLQSSFTFDSSMAGIFWTLATGGTLIVPRRHQEQDLHGLVALIREHRVSHTLCLPTLYALLLREASLADLATLQTVIVAGETCPSSLVLDHHRSLPHARLFNEYGPTEATVWSTVQELTADDAVDPVPIGRPIPRMRAYVLDAARRPVPPGVAGELWLAGAGLSRGYRNLAELTAERFASLDVSGTPEKAYRTGDLVLWRDDGTLAFLGRVDSQLKLRGRRIEPSGIESVLRARSDIAEAAVAVRGTPGRLVAYVVPRAHAKLDAGVLHGQLKALLADYLVPDRFVTLPSLPRTWSGKIDYRSLPEPEPPAQGPESVAPRSEIERVLADIWREVLGTPRVGIHDNFFALGGDSILSIQIVSRVRAAGLSIDPRHVLERPTIAQLADAIARTGSATVDLEPVVGEVPLAPIQSWFLGRTLAAPHHWNQSALFELPANIDLDRLRRALACVLAHHDQLRARFEQNAVGQWRQVVMPPGAVSLPFEVLELGNQPDPDAELEQLLLAAQASLDLGQAPLMRAVLLKRGSAQPLFLLAVHHLVIDAVSWGLLIEDLEEAYRQAATKLQPRLRTRTASFRSWAQAIHRHAATSPNAERLEPWHRLLRAAAQDLTLDATPAAPPSEADARTLRHKLPADLTKALLTRANEAYQSRTEELLLAALTLAIGRTDDNASLRLFREGHGRDGEFDLSHTVGWFTCMTPLALQAANPGDAGAVIRSVKEQLAAAPQPGQDYGLLRWSSDDPQNARLLEEAGDPLLLFNFLGRQVPPAEGAVFRRVAGADATSRAPGNARSHLLEINTVVADGRLVVDWIWCPEAHRRETIGHWAEAFAHEIARLVEHCVTEAANRSAVATFPDAELEENELGMLMERLAQR